MQSPETRSAPLDDDFAIKTWRYLRLAMVGLVIGLGAALLKEIGRQDFDCIQTSISAYYYTPVRGFFVGALVAIGVCLFCLKGNTPAEDALLNLAGMFAPVVGFVPTDLEVQDFCAAASNFNPNPGPNIANNMLAMFVVVGLAFGVLAVLWDRHDQPPAVIRGFAVAAGIFVAALILFYADRGFFVEHAHNAAAVAMFGCIFIVVVLNALGASKPTETKLYAAIAVAMAVSAVGLWASQIEHWVFAVEAAMIGLFAVFWTVQTFELWNKGVRETAA